MRIRNANEADLYRFQSRRRQSIVLNVVVRNTQRNMTKKLCSLSGQHRLIALQYAETPRLALIEPQNTGRNQLLASSVHFLH